MHVREPRVSNVIGFVDELALQAQCSGDILQQNAAYNGYHHDTTCNNVMAFSPTGKIFFAALNYPGSFHDAQVCHDLIRWCIDSLDEHALCVDQGFPRSGVMWGKFVGPLSRRQRQNLPPALRDVLQESHGIYVSLRQASEWGMRTLQGTFPRLKSRLTSNKLKRLRIIQGVVLLHNFRTKVVGLNQIATVFNPHLDTYDRIARYFN